MSVRFPIFAAAVLLLAASLQAQTAPATAGTSQPLKVRVTGVEGIVRVRTGEDQPWQPATVGMELDENAEFRTGPKSAVRFVIPPDQTITLDRLGVVKVLQAINDGGKVKTNLGMKYGRTRYDIEAAGVEHESTITSPSSTLAVRGTNVSVTDQRPFPAQAVSLTGRAEFRDAKKRVFFGGRGQGKTKVNTESANSASLSLIESVVDPSIALARTGPEQTLIAALLQSGATVSFDFEKGIRVIRGGGHPTTDQRLIPTLPGMLNFVLRWQGNADLNLSVVPGGNGAISPIYPVGGLDVSPTGGRTAFDHRGGSSQGGIEVVFWPAKFPDGLYLIGTQHISGPDVPATMDIYLNGKPVAFNTTGRVTRDGTTGKFMGTPTTSTPGIFVGSLTISDGVPQPPLITSPQGALRKR